MNAKFALLLPFMPVTRFLLALAKSKNDHAIRFLKVVSHSNFFFRIATRSKKSSCYPRATSRLRPAVPEVQSTFEHAPVRFAADLKPKPCGSAFKVRISDGSCH